MRKKLRKIYFGIFWAILIVSFVIFATLLILVANGYYFNFRTFKLQKTGMIILRGFSGKAKVSINSRNSINSLPIKFRSLLPGRYDIKIEKENYQNWERVFNLGGGQAIVKDNIYLFLATPTIKEKSNSPNDITVLQNNFKAGSNNITIKTNEIWLDDKLITRYSQPISGAFLDSDNYHIYVQIGDQIRVIESEGTNELNLIKLTDSSPMPFAVSGTKLDYLQNNTIFEATIR